MAASDEGQGLFRQVIVIAVPAFGAGAQADAGDYQDRGTHTVQHVAAYMGGLELPLMQWLGLGNIAAVRGVAPAEPPAATYGLLTRATEGRDPAGALDELVGAACRALLAVDRPVHAVGAAADLLAELDGVQAHTVGAKESLLDRVAALVPTAGHALIVAAPPAPPRSGPAGVARALAELDGDLATLLDQLPDDSLVLLSSLGGDDATVAVRAEATREHAPMLAYTPALPSGIDLGLRATLADIGATAAEVLGVGDGVAGTSFLGELLA